VTYDHDVAKWAAGMRVLAPLTLRFSTSPVPMARSIALCPWSSCRACGDELDVPTAVGDFIDGKGRAEFNKRAALKRLKEREAMAARIAEHQK